MRANSPELCAGMLQDERRVMIQLFTRDRLRGGLGDGGKFSLLFKPSISRSRGMLQRNIFHNTNQPKARKQSTINHAPPMRSRTSPSTASVERSAPDMASDSVPRTLR
eukprot:TRINITY_DN2028_c0_g4_i1.p1 TRINITY_DN2028_c0_g4~~TRINITY_DN2028_c0_g4_i1.p1  ORF type:complete len:108 (-),score=5.85 TRINITY_DN2028_c0_g4_i1:5-328(-)